ncbi:DUF501 domain-containing protein [Halanaerobacter jeridensis]|uniref:DUF501 domain-containing protein n=1 Tax=Halanaerobacter jeridensis TaxID=706427 RepID=A0A938XT04_9FIRM|nr:DUF501 domain-containing protein [Halanaerobacter jeridensis]MBM7557176.1 hypothetical protein [Halanaerobacter jeridensis]
MIDKEEKEILKKQLDREPRNIVDIPVRCAAGFPQVIVTAPILEDSDGIFPTTFWLTCPELNYRIAQLEDQGYVTRIKEKIDADAQLQEELIKAHEDYANYRVGLLTDEELNELQGENQGQYRVIKESGVGGIMDFEGIKCLHTHYAHYLVNQNNPVGRLTEQLLKNEYVELNPEQCKEKCQLEG